MVRAALMDAAAHLGGALGTVRSLSGGGELVVVLAEIGGASLVIKASARARPDLWRAEAAGLGALAATGAIRVPAVLGQGPTWLALEYIAPGRPRPDFGHRLGQALARVHGAFGEAYGFDLPTFCGPTRQDNTWESDWGRFFAHRRLEAIGRAVARAGCLTSFLESALDRLVATLPSRFGDAAGRPSLVHGDLWQGNVLADGRGDPCLIDPACFYGAAESDLAMLELFGSWPAGFREGYESVRPIDSNYAERRDIYQLYHLLNHVALFGRSYVAAAETAARRALATYSS